MFYKVWIVKHDQMDGFPLCNIFYTKAAARKLAKELKEHIGGKKWRVLEGRLQVPSS